jgi:hypothetical protein
VYIGDIIYYHHGHYYGHRGYYHGHYRYW